MSYPYTEALIGAPFKTPPYDHQIREFEKYAGAVARAKGWTMRTGKSKSVIDKACFLHTEGGEVGKIDGVLIFAPNGVHANWIIRELPLHTWDSVATVGLIWQSEATGVLAEKLKPSEERARFWDTLAKLKTDKRLAFLAVNSESMTRADVRKAVARFLKSRRRVFGVIDESDDFGTPGSIRTKMARALMRRCAYREILSGTIITGSPLAAFSQFECLKKGALGFERYQDFKARYAIVEVQNARGRQFPKVIGYQNEDELQERMARFISVVTRDDVKGMPGLVHETVEIEPTPQQLAIYRELHNSFRVAVENDEISVGERAPRLQKMQQVFSGFIKDEHGRVRKIPGGNPRLDALSREVFLAPGKVIIWCNFQADIDFVRERLLADGHKIAEYHGRVSDKAKSQALTTFRENRDVKALIGHVQSCGRGHDLSVAQKILNYSHTFSARLIVQALERATKIGAKNIHVVDFVAPGPDKYILSVTQQRRDVADAIAGTGMKNFLKRIAL